jgi:hypothetical protein
MWGSGSSERGDSCLRDGVRFVLRTNAHLIDDETVAKMGHPDLRLGIRRSRLPQRA